MRLILIRHGNSKHAVQGIIAGPKSCQGLTSLGVSQADRLAHRLVTTRELTDCDAILVSPVKRAVETAERLIPAFPSATFIEDRRLIEIDPGDADGLDHATYSDQFGVFDFISEQERPFAPGGESWSQFCLRIRGMQDDLATRFAGKTVVAITHAGTIVATLLQTFDIPRPGTSARFEPVYTSITEWQHDEAWVLMRYNDAVHLQTDIFERHANSW